MQRSTSFLLLLTALILTLSTTSAAAEEQTPSLATITISDNRLVVDGQPFEIRGVNYIHPSGNPAGCPELHFGAAGANCPWDRAAVESDMQRLHALGINTIRIFLNYYVFGGARALDPNYSPDVPLANLDALIDSANRQEIYVLPVLLAKYPQDQMNEAGQPLADLQLLPVISHLANRSGLLGWDLFNEPDIGSPIDERCWDWDNGDFPLCNELAIQRAAFLTHIRDTLRWFDTTHLTTIGMGFAKSYFRPEPAASQVAALVDFYSFHYYDNDPYNCGRYAQHWYYGQGLPKDFTRAIDELHTLTHPKPILVSELGFPSGEGTLRDTDTLRRDLRLSLQTSRDGGASGIILWPFQPSPEELVGGLFPN